MTGFERLTKTLIGLLACCLVGPVYFFEHQVMAAVWSLGGWSLLSPVLATGTLLSLDLLGGGFWRWLYAFGWPITVPLMAGSRFYDHFAQMSEAELGDDLENRRQRGIIFVRRCRLAIGSSTRKVRSVMQHPAQFTMKIFAIVAIPTAIIVIARILMGA